MRLSGPFSFQLLTPRLRRRQNPIWGQRQTGKRASTDGTSAKSPSKSEKFRGELVRLTAHSTARIARPWN